jgi:hypothetical protein
VALAEVPLPAAPSVGASVGGAAEIGAGVGNEVTVG